MIKLNRAIKLFFDFPISLWLLFISHLPGEIGFILRYHFWKRRLKYLGRKVRIDTGVYFQNPDYIVISDNCWIDKNVVILAGLDKSNREKIRIANHKFKGQAGVVHIGRNVHVGIGCIISGISAGVYIADDCSFSPYCKIYSFSHHYRSAKDPYNKNISFGSMVEQSRQVLLEGPVQIDQNVGFALNAIILPGVTIQANSFVCINSIVHNGEYGENSLISGNPAKVVGKRFEE